MAAPSVLSRQASVSSTTDSTSFTPTLPTVTAGKSLLACVSIDQAPGVNYNKSSGWIDLNTGVNGSTVTGKIFWKPIAEGNSNDNLDITCSSAQQYSAIVYCIDAGPFPAISCAVANGSGTNSDPPSDTIYASKDLLALAFRCGDAAVVPTVAPSSFSNLLNQAAGGANGASTSVAERAVTANNSNPGTFTAASEQWVCFTVLIWAEDRTRWSESDKGPNTTISGSDLSWSINSGSFEQGVRAVIPKKFGKWGFKGICVGGTDWGGIGIKDVVQWMGATGSSPWGTTAMIGNYNSTPVARIEVSNEITSDQITDSTPFSNGDTAYFVVDFDTGLFWAQRNSGDWNFDPTASPDAGMGGISFYPEMLGLWFFPVAYGDEPSGWTFDGSSGALSGAPNCSSFNYWDYVPSGGYALTASAGSLVVTGSVASVKAARKILSAVGSLALAAGDAAFNIMSAGRTLAAGAGVFVVTGNAAALRLARKLAGAQGVFAVSGNAATLKSARKLAAASGVLIVTGFAGSLRSSRKLVAAARSFAITGGTASFLRGRILQAALGLLSVTGNNASLKAARKLMAGAGSLVLAGGGTAFRRGKILIAGAGAFVASGYAAALRRAAILRAIVGGFLIGGQDAAFPIKRPFRWEPAAQNPKDWASQSADNTIWTEQGPGASPWSEV